MVSNYDSIIDVVSVERSLGGGSQQRLQQHQQLQEYEEIRY